MMGRSCRAPESKCYQLMCTISAWAVVDPFAMKWLELREDLQKCHSRAR
jgi:hypothetical protein